MTLSEDGFWTLFDHYNALVEQIPQPDLVVYLRAQPETLMDRVRLRGKDYEAAMTIDYCASFAAFTKSSFVIMMTRHCSSLIRMTLITEATRLNSVGSVI